MWEVKNLIKRNMHHEALWALKKSPAKYFIAVSKGGWIDAKRISL